MSDPSMVLRRRDELRNEIRDLERSLREIKSIKLIRVEGLEKSTFTDRRVCNKFLPCLHDCLKEAQEELKQIEDRIAKWE